jgi:hypothetical protein
MLELQASAHDWIRMLLKGKKFKLLQQKFNYYSVMEHCNSWISAPNSGLAGPTTDMK